MGREARRVPKDWQHPTDSRGYPIPMYNGDHETACVEYQRGVVSWNAGSHPMQRSEWTRLHCRFYWDYFGPPPPEYGERGSPMFEHPRDDLTHLQLYETTSEGTPIGPVFETLDELCEWAADNATTFGTSFRATVAEWHRMLDTGCVYHEETMGERKVMFL